MQILVARTTATSPNNSLFWPSTIFSSNPSIDLCWSVPAAIFLASSNKSAARSSEQLRNKPVEGKLLGLEDETTLPKSSRWFQPVWKICSSNWIISPGIGVKTKNNWVATEKTNILKPKKFWSFGIWKMIWTLFTCRGVGDFLELFRECFTWTWMNQGVGKDVGPRSQRTPMSQYKPYSSWEFLIPKNPKVEHNFHTMVVHVRDRGTPFLFSLEWSHFRKFQWYVYLFWEGTSTLEVPLYWTLKDRHQT